MFTSHILLVHSRLNGLSSNVWLWHVFVSLGPKLGPSFAAIPFGVAGDLGMAHLLKSIVGHSGATVVSLRCPICRHGGSFHGIPNCQDVTWLEPGRGNVPFQAGERKCPNPDCHALVQVILFQGNSLRVFRLR
jgi:hypothetical protein